MTPAGLLAKIHRLIKEMDAPPGSKFKIILDEKTGTVTIEVEENENNIEMNRDEACRALMRGYHDPDSTFSDEFAETFHDALGFAIRALGRDKVVEDVE